MLNDDSIDAIRRRTEATQPGPRRIREDGRVSGQRRRVVALTCTVTPVMLRDSVKAVPTATWDPAEAEWYGTARDDMLALCEDLLTLRHLVREAHQAGLISDDAGDLLAAVAGGRLTLRSGGGHG